jgi:hypothetical protein
MMMSASLDFYCDSLLKQQSVGRHDAPLGHIILISSQPVSALTPYCCVISGKHQIPLFGLWIDPTRPELEPTIYRT